MSEFVYLTDRWIIPVDRICWIRIGHYAELEKPWRLVVCFWLRDDSQAQTRCTYYETEDAAKQEACRLLHQGVIY